MHAASDTASAAGLPMAYDYGSQRMCWLGHPITNWMGDDGFLKRLYGEVRRFNYIGDTSWVKAKVSGKSAHNGEHLVDLEVWVENQGGEVVSPGEATVALPSRSR